MTRAPRVDCSGCVQKQQKYRGPTIAFNQTTSRAPWKWRVVWVDDRPFPAFRHFLAQMPVVGPVARRLPTRYSAWSGGRSRPRHNALPFHSSEGATQNSSFAGNPSGSSAAAHRYALPDEM